MILLVKESAENDKSFFVIMFLMSNKCCSNIYYILGGVISSLYHLRSNFMSFSMCSPMRQCPITWQNKWEGPEEPMQYLRAVVTRAIATQVRQQCAYME